MERDYKLEKSNYYETLWYIRQYPLMLKERSALLGVKGVSYGGVKGTSISDPTPEQADKLFKLNERIRPIEEALEKVPEEYQKGLMDNIIKRKRYPDYADTSTWKRWRRRLIYWVAKGRE